MAITLSEVARLAGVSSATVSLVLNGKAKGRVSAARSEAILQLARKHGYRANVTAKGLVKGRHYRVAVCWGGPITPAAVQGQIWRYEALALLARSCHAAGYAIELSEVDVKRPPEEVTRKLAESPVDAFILLGWPPDLAAKALFHLRMNRIPAAATGVRVDDPELTWSAMDTEAVFRDATRQLVSEGHGRVGFIMVSTGTSAPRLHNGFLAGMGDVTEGDPNRWVFTPSFGDETAIRDAVRRMVDDGVTAMLLYDNYYVNIIYDALRQCGVTPGDAFRIIGYGATILADRAIPQLSHYSQRIQEQVEFCISALLDEIRAPEAFTPRSKLFGPQYQQRDT